MRARLPIALRLTVVSAALLAVTAAPAASDADGDGIPDTVDPAALDASVCGDYDRDGCDDCAVTGRSSPDADGPDLDGDGICDVGDTDADGDGQHDDWDPDPTSRFVCGDSDEDGCDDCSVTGVLNPRKDGPDLDGDGLCDASDGDDDGDGVLDGKDPAPTDPWVCGDADYDTCDDCASVGHRDAAEDGPDADGDGLCDAGDPDADGDGLDREAECGDAACPDTDGDGLPDDLDPDDDGDGIPTSVEVAMDPDGSRDGDADGLPSYLDTDADGDGRSDAEECPDPAACADTDGDLRPDVFDPDDDGDGLATADELALGTDPMRFDSDGDGVGDGEEVRLGLDPLWSGDEGRLDDGDLPRSGKVPAPRLESDPIVGAAPAPVGCASGSGGAGAGGLLLGLLGLFLGRRRRGV